MQRNPLGQTSSAKYDSLGKVTETTDELGRRTNFTYDTVNRMTNIAYTDAQVGYTYDTLNRITQISDTQGGTLNWSYDALGQVQSETTANGIVSYTYNDARQRISMTALNRPSVNYGYDSAGRLANINQGNDIFGYNYDSISRMISLTRPNSVNTSYEYDQVNRLKRMTHGTIEDFKYEYNLDDEISAIKSLNSATILPNDKNSSGANNANRITQFGEYTFSFNDKGQTTTRINSSGTATYSWDIRGRLKNVALPNGETVNYNYDALGRRTSRTSNNQTTNFVYDGQNIVADTGSSTADYLNGLRVDDKLKVNNEYFLKDHLSSTIALTDNLGNVTESQKYEAFGKSNLQTSRTRYGYTGREKDDTTNLMYYRARWYDAEQGRFLSSDPIEFSGGMNFYSYVGNSPLNKIDPSGLQDTDVIILNSPPYVSPPPQYDYRSVDSTWRLNKTSPKFPNLNLGDLNKRDYQCRSMKELLRREEKYGTWQASADSSVTTLGWGGRSPLDGLNNHSTGNLPYYGNNIDVDFMMDTHKYSGGLAGNVPGVATVVYSGGVMINTVRKRANGEGWDSWYPNHDPGEQLGTGFIEDRYQFKDIFDKNWFKEHCPCED